MAFTTIQRLRNIFFSGYALEVHQPHPQNGSKQTSQDGINMGPEGKAKPWQTEGELAQNYRERKNSFKFQFLERGNDGSRSRYKYYSSSLSKFRSPSTIESLE